MVRLTTSASGFQNFSGPSSSSPAAFFFSVRPPRKYEISPHLAPAISSRGFRCSVHRRHSKRKCLAVSSWPDPHSHSLDSTTLELIPLRGSVLAAN
jgi:hypothetical protein